ncbi:MAG: CD3324 family protein [Lachnospiraceae bacterium]|nr:CD3324 family protein [Lachnospiraceae bacterium]
MKYINANAILPEMLVEELQKYVQAGYIYVPAKDEQRKSWGELSGYRRELSQRNDDIIDKYQKGVSMETLAEEYCLSVYAIRKVIYQK